MKRLNLDNSSHKNDRWLISYSDFITLLFAFFVVMYAISTLNEGKYQTLATSLEKAFVNNVGSDGEVDLENLKKHLSNFSYEDYDPPVNNTVNHPDDDKEFSLEHPFEFASTELKNTFKGLIDRGVIEIYADTDWLEIKIQSEELFDSGYAEVNSSASNILKSIAKVLAKFENPVNVEGFTDNFTINNDLYGSNWELSASRAASIVEFFERSGLDSKRLSAVGYGANFPIADNSTIEGRKKNRRIVLMVGKEDARKKLLTNMNYEDKEAKKVKDSIKYNSDNVENFIPGAILKDEGDNSLVNNIKNQNNAKVKTKVNKKEKAIIEDNGGILLEEIIPISILEKPDNLEPPSITGEVLPSGEIKFSKETLKQ